MNRFITPASIANEIMLLRDVYQGSILLVEGPSDKRVYSKFVNHEHCEIIIAHGKENALVAVDIIDSYEFDGVLSIVDADFSRLEGWEPSNSNVLLTDTHDLESMILYSPALDHVLSEFGSQDKINKFMKTHGSTPRNAILNAAIPLGCLRFISFQRNLNLKFEGLKFKNLLRYKSQLRVILSRLVNCVCALSQDHRGDRSELITSIELELQKDHDPWQLVCGHDMVFILTISLWHLFGTNRQNQVTLDMVNRILHVSYQEIHFRQSQLYSSIINWEAQSGFQILFTMN